MKRHGERPTGRRWSTGNPVFRTNQWLARALAGVLVLPVSSWSTPRAKYQVDYFLDDCTVEWSIGRGGVGDLWVANAFTVQDGAEVIVSIEASFYNNKGWPLGVHLYDDPDDDGNPDDAVLLQSLQTTFPSFGSCHEFPIPPTEVSGIFFAALSYADYTGIYDDQPLFLDDTLDRGKTWYVETSVPGSLDPANFPSAPLRQSTAFPGQFFIRATGVPSPVPMTGIAYAPAGPGMALEWASVPGAYYEVLKITDMGLGDWTVLDPDRVPPDGATGAISVYSDATLTDGTACYRVRRTTPPVIYEEDFETGAAGWVTSSADPGHPTQWELGELNAGPYSAHSGTQAYGTTLGGNYANNAHAILRSPLIDLTGVARAKLGFWYIGDFGDNNGNDHGRVEILDSSETPLLEDHISGLSTWFWDHRKFVLPKGAGGNQIYLRFTLDDHNDGNVARGVYVDDLSITELPPLWLPMILIEGGSFAMGDTFAEGNADELPVHTVTVSPFSMDPYEVTNDRMVEVLQWAHDQNPPLIDVTSSSVRNTQGASRPLLDLGSVDCRITWTGSRFEIKSAKGAGYPCVTVTWFGAAAYCNYRSLQDGLTPCYDMSDWSCNWDGGGYRLPTEAEWEYAARGGESGLRFPWGANINHAHANYWAFGFLYTYDTSPYLVATYHPDYDDGEFPYTSPVGCLPPNGFGLYDMAGNVREWCGDWYDEDYYDVSGDSTDPAGPPSGSLRAIRGGSWGSRADACRVAVRGSSQGWGTRYIGFRAVRRAGL